MDKTIRFRVVYNLERQRQRRVAQSLVFILQFRRMRPLSKLHHSGSSRMVTLERERIQTRERMDLVLLCLHVRMNTVLTQSVISCDTAHSWARQPSMPSIPELTSIYMKGKSGMMSRVILVALHQAVNFSLDVSLFEGFAFVGFFLAARESDVKL
jgi:hypothetical protein